MDDLNQQASLRKKINKIVKITMSIVLGGLFISLGYYKRTQAQHVVA
jgi:hypothetical protein